MKTNNNYFVLLQVNCSNYLRFPKVHNCHNQTCLNIFLRSSNIESSVSYIQLHSSSYTSEYSVIHFQETKQIVDLDHDSSTTVSERSRQGTKRRMNTLPQINVVIYQHEEKPPGCKINMQLRVWTKLKPGALCMTGGIINTPSLTNVCNFFNFQLAFSQLILHLKY